MHIAEIHLYQHDLPVKGGPYRIASSEVWSLTSTLVELVADNGVVGWGGDIIAAACTHVGATVEPARLEGVWLAAPYVDGHLDAENGIRIESGHITVPRGQGLGVTPDEERFGDAVASFEAGTGQVRAA